MSQIRLREIYLPPYKAAIEAGAATVMSAFNALNGVPASANPFLLRTILRGGIPPIGSEGWSCLVMRDDAGNRT